jgi:hypothetical protein
MKVDDNLRLIFEFKYDIWFSFDAKLPEWRRFQSYLPIMDF